MEQKLLSNGVDRISNLPLHMQHLILAYLPPQNMVQTCLLSKHWTHIWCSVPHLDLSDTEDENDRIKSHNFVNSLLLLRDGESKIQTFRLKMKILVGEMRKVITWILYALKHNVEVLDLGVYTDYNDIDKLIPSIFVCKSLRELTLHFCDLNMSARICLPALRYLKLKDVTIPDGKLFSGIHSLETLILGHACFVESSTLKISATQLKILKMDVQLNSSFVISAPNLVSVDLFICQELPGNIEFQGEMVYLNDAVINIEGVFFEAAVQLLSAVKYARSLLLTVSENFDCEIIKELRKDIATLNRIQFHFSNLKLLRIEIWFSQIDFVFINNILKHSPQLGSLFLRNTGGDTETTDVEHCQDIWSKHKLSQLKLVEVHDFNGTKAEVEMV